MKTLHLSIIMIVGIIVIATTSVGVFIGKMENTNDDLPRESTKTSEILTIGNKIANANGLVPVTVTEVTNHAESLTSVTIWTFRPVDRYEANSHITLNVPRNFSTSQVIVNEYNDNVIDKSRMPENYAIAGTGLSFPVTCSFTEKVVGDGDSPYTIPIKKGNSLIFVKGNSFWGVYPDSNGQYSIKYASPFETQVEFPNGTQIISNEVKSCFLDQKMYNFTKAFYTKIVFKMN
jgi:hypothetical protein